MGYIVVGGIIALFVLLVVFDSGPPADGGEHSIGHNATYGRYRVLYPDGQLSQPFHLSTAKDYAEMFDGWVVPREFRPSLTTPTEKSEER